MTIEDSAPPDSTADTKRAGRALGSPLRLTVAAGPHGWPVDAQVVDRAWSEIERVFAEVDAGMSRFRDDSELTRLNLAHAPVLGLSRLLVAALTAADRATRMTQGRFDARVLRDLERLGFAGVPQVRDGEASTPGPAPAAGPGRLVRRSGRHGAIELLAPVDLGGIGKGLALRWAAAAAGAVLGDAGFLLDAGGDLVSHGMRAGEPWSIGIEDPTAGGDPLAVVVLHRDQAIATSSVRIASTVGADGRLVHHLIDPRTGEPGGAGLAAVTVAWRDPAWAEVWSKALFLEGVTGIADAARSRGLAAWWVHEDGELSMTPAARQQTSWVLAEARRVGG
ncbi:MAG: FAD:protein FMN transferase [Chloroflexota bacterium]